MSLRSMIAAFKPNPVPPSPPRDDLLIVRIDGMEVARIGAADIPCELERSVAVDGAATVEFVDAADRVHRHQVPPGGGWLHVNVRVHPNLGCQADAVVTAHPTHEAGAAIAGDEIGVRFQPFFLAGAAGPDLAGRGLFARGLHFSGRVTPGNILLSCECDRCARTFIARSFHAGFAESGYFYSGSGRYTLIVGNGTEGSPAALADPDPAALAALEAKLPVAPDGSGFTYLNPFRCPRCAAPYIDFAAYPAQRPDEYYALYLPDTPLLRFEPAADDEAGGR